MIRKFNKIRKGEDGLNTDPLLTGEAPTKERSQIYRRRFGDIEGNENLTIKNERGETISTPEWVWVDDKGNPIKTNEDLFDNTNYLDYANDQTSIPEWRPAVSTNIALQTQNDKADQNWAYNQIADRWVGQNFSQGAFLGEMLKPLNFLSPSQQIGALRNWISGETDGKTDEDGNPLGYWRTLAGEKNYGIFTKNFNKEHPGLAMAGNIIFDFGTGIAGLDALEMASGNNLTKGMNSLLRKINNSYIKYPRLGRKLMKEIDLGIDEIPVTNRSNTINLESGAPSTEKLLTLNQADQINQLSRAVNENREFIKAYNEWNKFGYPEVPKGLEYDTDQLNAFVRGQLDRHNTYARGVDLYPGKGYKPALEAKLGRTLTDEEFLRYAATHPMETDVGQPMLWITPSTNLAGGYGKVALVRRPFKLGKNRMNWFDEASFDIESSMRPSTYNASDVKLINDAEKYTEIHAPWTRMGDKSGIERELGAPYEMDFIEWLQNFTHGRHKVSLNNKVGKFNPPLNVEELRQFGETHFK